MSALGSLVVSLALEHARYTAGLDKSEQATLASLKRIQGAADQFSARFGDTIKTGLGSLAAFFTAGAITAQVKAVVDDLDRIADKAASIGLATQSLAELGYAAKLSGADAETLEGAMGKLNLKISEAASGNKEAAKLFDALGVKVKDAEGKVRSTDAVLADLSETFKALPEGPTKSALAVEFFGKTGAGLLQFLSQGKDGLQDLRNEFVALSGGSIEDAAAMAGAFNDQMDKLSVVAQAATIRFGSELLPTLTEVASMFTDTGEDALGLGAGMDAASLAGAGLRTLLETVLLLGSDVAYVLNGMGREIGGIVAQFSALGEGGGIFSAAGRKAWSDVGEAMRTDAEEARRKLDDFQARLRAAPQKAVPSPEDAAEKRRNDEKRRTSKEALDATARAQAALAKEGEGAKAAAAAYDTLMQSIRARLHLADQQLSLGRELTDAEKFEAKAKEDLAKIADKLSSGKVAAAEKEIAATKVRIEQAEIEKQIAKEMTAIAQERQRTRNAEMDSIAKWFQAQEEEVAQTLSGIRDRVQGLRDEAEAMATARRLNISLAEAIEVVAIARLQEKQAGFYEGSEGWENLEREIRARKELLPLLSTKELREREERGWSDLWNSIDRTAHDVWTNIWEGGDNVFKKLGQTIKATVLDLLYQLTVRPFIIEIGTSVFGSGFADAAKAATGGGSPVSMMGGLGNIVSNGMSLLTNGVSTSISNAFGKFANSEIGSKLGLSYYDGNAFAPTNLGATVGTGLGMLGNGMMGYGISSAISSGYTTGGNTVNVLSGIASAFFGPLAGVVGGLINRLFGRKLADVGIEGTFGGTAGFDGQSFEYYKGGLLRSDKTKYSDLDPEFEKALGDTFKGMRAQVAFFADALGLSADRLEGYTSKIKFSTQGLNAEQIQEKFQEALATANNELAEQVLGTWETTSEKVTRRITRTEGNGQDMVQYWEDVEETITSTTYKASQYAKENEKAIDTLTRLATSLTTVNSLFDTLGYTLLDASLAGADAASKIADAFGGLDKMVSATAAYFQNFYSEDERRAVARRQLDKQLDDVGIADIPKTREEYRRLVEAQDLNTEAGRKAYAVLVQLSGVFAELTLSADQAAEAAREEARSKLDAAYSALERAIAVQRKSLEAQRAAASELADLWGTVADIASSAMRDLRAEVSSTAAQQAAQGMVFIENALAGALAGQLPNAEDLSNALTAARGGLNADNYASQFELDRDRLVLAGQMEQLAAAAGKQKTTAELQLESLDRQLQQGEDTLDYWKEQIALATDQAETMLSIAEATDAIRKLIDPASKGGAIPVDKLGAGGGSGAGGITWGGTADPAKYSRPVNIPGGTVYVGVSEEEEKKLDPYYSGYHAFDGTNDADGLNQWIRDNNLKPSDMSALSGLFEKDWASWFVDNGIPAFAGGGDHLGGWALVGEQGPELAYMPPARIYNAADTRRMQSPGDGSAATVRSTGKGVDEAAKKAHGDALTRIVQVLEDAFEGNGFRFIPA
jgi:hypothetical protein